MATQSHANSNDAPKKKQSRSGYDLRRRARTGLSTVRKEATAPRLAAAAAIGAAAAAVGLLSSSSRREQLGKSASDLKEKWIPSSGNRDAIGGEGVGAAPGA